MNIIREAMKSLPGHWHKGGLTDRNGNYCGLGHIINAFDLTGLDITGHTSAVDVYYLLDIKAKEMFPDRLGNENTAASAAFPQVNDHPDTTEEDILAVMEKAAIAWEESVE